MAHVPDPSAARLGTSLRRWRTLNRIKQTALAADLGVSQTTVSRWEAGLSTPEGATALRVAALLAARPSSASDHALLRLVRTAAEPAHLICDLTHRLLAVSPGRAADWHLPAEELLGRSLWPFASEGIAQAEARLDRDGWYEPEAPGLTVRTERAEFAQLTIPAGFIRWVRVPLSDGSFARLVTDENERTPA